MEDLGAIVNKFGPVRLEEMDEVALQDRIDTKFIFPEYLVPTILQELTEHYWVLEVAGSRVNDYKSLYFDTPSFGLYHEHHRGKLNRFKVRYREYSQSGTHYFEVKLKNNKGRTIKYRVPDAGMNAFISEPASKLLDRTTEMVAGELEPKLMVSYTRLTLVSKKKTERVTIDMNLRFHKDPEVRDFGKLVIAELKQSEARNSKFSEVMRKFGIRSLAISKYCYGVISLYNNIKYNNFKPRLISINKIRNGIVANTHRAGH